MEGEHEHGTSISSALIMLCMYMLSLLPNICGITSLYNISGGGR